MSEEAKPVVETPAAPVAEAAPVISTEIPAAEPTEAKPAEETAAKSETEAAASTEEKKPLEPKSDGHLHYNAPTNFLKEFMPLKKAYFWFGEAPIESKELTHYLAKGKEAAHSTAAWASQTGTGLLYFAKGGDKKEAPTGVLNLADAEDIKESGTSAFTFNLHGHKHKFDAHTPTERDSWLASVKKVAEEAKAKKDEIVNSEGYKEALAKLKPVAPVAAVAAATGATEESAKKSTDTKPVEETADAEEAKKTSKSRSRSRGAPSNIIGFFKGKKDEVKEETKPEEAKKDEAVVPEAAPAAEAAPAEPAPETVTAPVITDAIPPVEEKKDDVKAGRRMSRFESFFKGNKVGEKAPEKKSEAAAPTIEEPPKLDVTEPIVEPATEAPVEAATEEKKEAEVTTPTKERKPSFLAGIKGFTQKVRSPSSEHPPAEPAAATEATETAVASETPAPAVAEASEVPATNGETKAAPSSPAETKEKRRSSMFNFGSFTKGKTGEKVEKKTESSTEEPAKTEVTEEAEEPAATVDAAASEEKPVEAKPEKESKESPLVSLGRRVSKVIRGDKPKKDAKAPPKVEESSEAPTLPETTTETSAPKEAEPAKEVKPSAPTGPTSIGDVVPEAVNVGTAPPSNPTVSATA